MAWKFNPFTVSLDLVGGGTTTWKTPVADSSALPTAGNSAGDARVTLDTDEVWVWDATGSRWENQNIQAGSTPGSTPNSVGYSISVNETVADLRTKELTLQPADSSNPGVVSTAAQNFAGNKTFDNDVTVTGDLTVNGTTTTVNTSTLDVTDANITVNNGGNQATADSNDAGITVEMSDATDAIIGYDSTLTSKFHIGEVGSVAEIADVSSSQTLTNKTLVAANNTITTAASGNLTATELNSALAELQTDIDGRANTSLSNLASTSINTDLTFQASLAGTLKTEDNGAGNSEDLTLSTGTATGTRGNLILSGEEVQIDGIGALKLSTLSPWWSGAFGIPALELDGTTADANNAFATGIIHKGHGSQSQFVITTEEQTSGSNTSSDINIYTGYHAGTGSTGDVLIYSGEQTGSAGNTGQVKLNSSDSANGSTGQVELSSGAASTFSGQARITTGGAATSGGINLTTGTGTTASGNIIITTGGSAGTRGRIDLDGRKINLDSNESIDLIQQQRITNVADPTANQDAATKAYVDSVTSSAAGDLDPTTFSIANNQATAANVTGFAFANGVTRSFSAHVSVEIDADTDLFEVIEIKGIQRGADWVISQSSTGDATGIVFSITTAGQIQYTSDNYAGFVSGDIKFRAITTAV